MEKRTVKLGCDDNGMYWGEIRDEDGQVESGVIERTHYGLQKWCIEKDVTREEWLNGWDK
jgi:hypothetical protein